MKRAVIFFQLLLIGCAAQPPATEPVQKDVSAADVQTARDISTYLSANFARGEHDLDQAARFYPDSLARDPGNAGLLALSFFYSATAGDFDAAGRYAAQVVAGSPDDRYARLVLATIALRNKDYAGAHQHLAASAKGPYAVLVPSLIDAWARAGLHNQDAVSSNLKALAAQKGAESLAAYHAALLADFLGNARAAETGYKSALSPNVSARVIDAYGRFLEIHSRSEDAQALYRGHGSDTELLLVTQPGLARIAARQKPEPLVRSPEDGAAEALFGIAASLTDQQSADTSIFYLRMAMYLRPDLARANILLAERYEILHKFDEAIAVYSKVQPDSPYYRVAQVEAAVNESRLGRNDNAIAGLKKLVAKNPGDVESWIALGDAYRGAERYGPAVDAFDHAINGLGTPGRDNWGLYFARATAKEKLGRLDESEADIQAALKLSPDQPELLNYLGYSWVDRGRNIPDAMAMLEKARSLRPYDGYIVDSVGWAYYRMGRYADAAATLEQAVLLVPGDPTINDHFGDALWRAGRHIEARFQWNHAITFADSDTDKAVIERKLKSGLSG